MTEENNKVEEKKTEGTIDTENKEVSVDRPENVETTDQPIVQTATDLSQPPPLENPLEPEPPRTATSPPPEEPTTATDSDPPVEIPTVFDEPPAPAETPPEPEPTCEQLVTKFQELARDKQEIDSGIQNLENAQKTFQDENINKSLEDARSLKKEVDEKIHKVIEESFGKNCRT